MTIFKFLYIVLVFQAVHQFTFSVETGGNNKADLDYRLPKNVLPKNYFITIDPNLETFEFSGEEEIEIICIENTSNITIHINEIGISNYGVFDENWEEVPTSESSIDEERQFFIIEINGMLLNGATYYLKLGFHGQINSLNKGFYKSSYFDYTKNETRYLVSTQMQATEARRVFPCFDEPQLKAEFSINLYRPSDYNSDSNMHLVESIVDEDNPNRVLDVYEKTPPISTYIIAFIISDFAIAQNGKYRVYGRPEQISNGNGDYALAIGQACIEWMEEFTGIPYELEKLDQIAMPNRYFDLGGMENWGMVVYKERVLLYNDSVTTTDEKQRLATVISHEFAHQWFGDLVTPLWFNSIWLNEGFATYFELHTMHQIEPSWRLAEQYTLQVVQNAMRIDALGSSRPMTFDADTPAEINALYDNIAYEKSGSVLRMAEHFLTPKTFQNALKLHLLRNEYSNVDSDNLWETLQDTVDALGPSLPQDLTVKQIMSTWEYQAGYPVVNVQRFYATGILQLEQERFLLYNDTDVDDATWVIPINYASESNANFSDTFPTDWMVEKDLVISTSVTESEWLILNKQQIGYYRVNYDPTNWNLIINALKSDNIGTISPVNRAQLIDDAFNLARSGRLNYETTLSLSSYLIQEDDYIPLFAAVNAFNHLNLMLSGSSEYTSFKNFVMQNLENTFKYGLQVTPDEDHLVKMTRINVFPLLCSLGYTQCLDEAYQIFENWRLADLEFHQDIQNIVYCNGIRQGDPEDWEFLAEQYRNSREDTQRLRMLNALGCSSNAELLNGYLNNITSGDTFVNDFEKLQAIQAIYNSGKFGVDFAINYLQNSFSSLFGGYDVAQVEVILKNIGAKINSEQQLADFKQMVTDSVNPILLDAANAAIKDAEKNLMWINTYAQSIIDWINTA